MTASLSSCAGGTVIFGLLQMNSRASLRSSGAALLSAARTRDSRRTGRERGEGSRSSSGDGLGVRKGDSDDDDDGDNDDGG